MPAAKRPLGEVDTNASRPQITSSSKYKLLKPGDKYGITSATDHSSKRQKQDESNDTKYLAPEKKQEDGINYKAKDNSRLRTFLTERDLPSTGSREDMIARLESHPIDYDSLLSVKLSEMLQNRGVVCSGYGSREIKIERLRVNDMNDRETGQSGESVLYGKLSAHEAQVSDLENPDSRIDYANLKPERISLILSRRNLSTSGTIAIKVERLKRDDKIKLQKAKETMEGIRIELEAKTGRRPVNTAETLRREAQCESLDSKIREKAAPTRPKLPSCQYNWKDSHWATRSVQELGEISKRLEMPGGSGTKAAMIKWLETGSLDYEDISTDALKALCRERELRFKWDAKKVDLIEILQANDDREDGGTSTEV